MVRVLPCADTPTAAIPIAITMKDFILSFALEIEVWLFLCQPIKGVARYLD